MCLISNSLTTRRAADLSLCASLSLFTGRTDSRATMGMCVYRITQMLRSRAIRGQTALALNGERPTDGESKCCGRLCRSRCQRQPCELSCRAAWAHSRQAVARVDPAQSRISSLTGVRPLGLTNGAQVTVSVTTRSGS